MTQDFYTALNTVKKVLAIDFACAESDFEKEGVSIYLARELPGRRKFPFREKFLAVVTMGKGVVVCCSAGRLRWAKANLSKLTRDEIFGVHAAALMEKYVKHDYQSMVGHDLKYLCTQDNFQPYSPHSDVELSLIKGETLKDIHKNNLFPNALGYAYNPQRPNMIASLAKCEGVLAGVAAASADCDVMWQIGVETLPEYRNRGIGKATVSAVTEYILKQGIIPYYSTAVANIASRSIATSLGFKPAWVELYSREIKA